MSRARYIGPLPVNPARSRVLASYLARSVASWRDRWPIRPSSPLVPGRSCLEDPIETSLQVSNDRAEINWHEVLSNAGRGPT